MTICLVFHHLQEQLVNLFMVVLLCRVFAVKLIVVMQLYMLEHVAQWTEVLAKKPAIIYAQELVDSLWDQTQNVMAKTL